MSGVRVPSLLMLALALVVSGFAAATAAAGKPVHSYTKADQHLAGEVVFHLGDFPTGWRSQIDTSKNGSPACFNPNLSDLTLTGEASSHEYVHGDATFAEALAVVFKSHAMALSAFKRLAVENLIQCFSSYIKQQSSSNTKIKNVSSGRLNFPHLGDRSAAYQIAIELESHGLSPTAYVDPVFIERGRVLSLLLFFDVLSPFSEPLEERLSRAVAQRMKEGTATKTVYGSGYHIVVPRTWNVTRSGKNVTASPGPPLSTPQLVSVSVFDLLQAYKPSQFAAATKQLDGAAHTLAGRLGGTVDSSRTVVVAGIRARQYVLRYGAGARSVTQRLTFVLRAKTEFQLLCRWISDNREPQACSMLTATFAPG